MCLVIKTYTASHETCFIVQFPVFNVLSGTGPYKSCVVFQEEFDCCTACCFESSGSIVILFIMSDSLCLSYPMVALNLMEAVLCSPIKVLRFCSELDYGCGA